MSKWCQVGRALGLMSLTVALLWPGFGQADPGPVSHSVNVTGCIPAPGEVPPVITSPVSGTETAQATITLKGTALASAVLTITRNGVDAGTTIVSAAGKWQIQISLVPGLNTIIARTCFSSEPITVVYTPPQPPPAPPGPPRPPSPTGTGGTGTSGVAGPVAGSSIPPGSFYLEPLNGVVTIDQGEEVVLSFVINGGRAPFTLVWDWGDGSTDTQHSENNELVQGRHTYKKPGTYLVTVTVTDSLGQRVILSFVVKVNPPDSIVQLRKKRPPLTTLPAVIALELLLVLALWSLWKYDESQTKRKPPPDTA